jgi:hypothetical protein
MNIESLSTNFKNWLLEKGVDPNDNSLYEAAIEEAVNQFANSTYNEMPYVNYYPLQEHSRMIFQTWKHTIEMMLNYTDSSMIYKGVRISEYNEVKSEILSQIKGINE